MNIFKDKMRPAVTLKTAFDLVPDKELKKYDNHIKLHAKNSIVLFFSFLFFGKPKEPPTVTFLMPAFDLVPDKELKNYGNHI